MLWTSVLKPAGSASIEGRMLLVKKLEGTPYLNFTYCIEKIKWWFWASLSLISFQFFSKIITHFISNHWFLNNFPKNTFFAENILFVNFTAENFLRIFLEFSWKKRIYHVVFHVVFLCRFFWVIFLVKKNNFFFVFSCRLFRVIFLGKKLLLFYLSIFLRNKYHFYLHSVEIYKTTHHVLPIVII